MRLAVARALALALSCAASPTAAQSPVLVMGRVHDAVTDEPVASVVVTAGDADRSVRTDSLGGFAIQVEGPAPYVVSAVRVGYQPATFELPESARSEVSVLALEPAILLGGFVLPEDRVRIDSPALSGEFRVAQVRSDALLLRPNPPSATFEVPTTTLVRLEVSRGRETSRMEGFFGGAFAGGLVGGLLGVQCNQPHYDCVSGMTPGTGMMIGAGLGALVGLIVARVSGDVWEEVSLPNSRADRDAVDDLLAARADAALGDVALGQAVELRVRNLDASPVTAYVWWEGGGTVPLGEVGAHSTRTFRSAYRSSGVALFVHVLSDPDVNPRRNWRRPSSFILVAQGARLEWTVVRATSGIVEDYVRLNDR